MSEIVVGAFIGRFQLFHLGHLQTTQNIRKEFPGIRLGIGVADWRGKATRENFLTGVEASHIAKLSLTDAGLTQVKVVRIEVSPDRGLLDCFKVAVERWGISLIFSGSSKTLTAIRRLEEEGLNVHAIGLCVPNGSIRATHIRQSLLEGTNSWKDCVTPSVMTYVNSRYHELTRRLKGLDEGEKRPWPIEGGG